MSVLAPQDGDGGVLSADARLPEAIQALDAGRIEVAEKLVRSRLDDHPNDANALKLLAEIAIRCHVREDAEQLLAQCLQIAPDFRAARYRYAQVLFELNKARKAVEEIDKLLKENPDNPECLSLKAVALSQAGAEEEALACHELLLRDHPDRPGFWLNYASDLRAAGRQSDAIAAYRAAIDRFPGLAEAYWSLGNLKMFRFAPEEVAAMERELACENLTLRDRSLLHFALGKEKEDGADYEASFDHYAKANALRQAEVHHDRDQSTREFARMKAFFSPGLFAERAGSGHKAPGAIFIVGLPRAGSTLLAQMLGSHPEIEAIDELVNINAIGDRLEGTYPDGLNALEFEAFEALGEEYLDEIRPLRMTDKPFFVDKMPDNFRHVGLIHLILPQAKIIDMRRHPMACGFSNFKQDFEAGYSFANGLADFGQYSRDYVDMMSHFDKHLPGRVLRVHYEMLIENPDGEIRRVLDYLGLPFDEKCLRFHERERAIRTASSEQVRMPLFATAIEQWRHYETWLEPLRQALGTAMAAYPGPQPHGPDR